MLPRGDEERAVKSESEPGKHRAHKGELSGILGHEIKRARRAGQRLADAIG